MCSNCHASVFQGEHQFRQCPICKSNDTACLKLLADTQERAASAPPLDDDTEHGVSKYIKEHMPAAASLTAVVVTCIAGLHSLYKDAGYRVVVIAPGNMDYDHFMTHVNNKIGGKASNVCARLGMRVRLGMCVRLGICVLSV
jgi:hypothetical protein